AGRPAGRFGTRRNARSLNRACVSFRRVLRRFVTTHMRGRVVRAFSAACCRGRAKRNEAQSTTPIAPRIGRPRAGEGGWRPVGSIIPSPPNGSQRRTIATQVLDEHAQSGLVRSSDLEPDEASTMELSRIGASLKRVVVRGGSHAFDHFA